MKHTVKRLPLIHGCYLRLLEPEDALAYYEAGFAHPDAECYRLSGTTQVFTKDQILSYVMRVTAAKDRYDFLIMNAQDQMLGEAVLNEFDETTKTANFRIALFSMKYANAGIGKAAVQAVCSFGLHTLHRNAIHLDVYDFNPRAIHVYTSCGFQPCFVEPNAIKLDSIFHSCIHMELKKEKLAAEDKR